MLRSGVASNVVGIQGLGCSDADFIPVHCMRCDMWSKLQGDHGSRTGSFVDDYGP